MDVNGAGIYGSKAKTKLGEGKNGKIKLLPQSKLGKRQADCNFSADDFRFTVGKDDAIYAYCLTVPAPGTVLKIHSLGNQSKRVTDVSPLGRDSKIE